MIDLIKPVRFVGGHSRVRIFGNAGGTDLWARHHDGNEWRTTKVTKDGAPVHYPHDMRVPSIENYSIDWDRPLAFQDTGEQAWLNQIVEEVDKVDVLIWDSQPSRVTRKVDQTIYVTDAVGHRYLFNQHGMPLRRDGDFEVTARDIMNVGEPAAPADDVDPWTDLTDQERKLLDFQGRRLIIPIIRKQNDGWMVALEGTPVLELYRKGYVDAHDVRRTVVQFERTGKGIVALRNLRDETAARAAAEVAQNEANPLWGMF